MIKSEQIVKAATWLEKFRKTIIAILFIVVISSSLMYLEADYIIDLLIRPLNGINLYFITPVEGVMTKIKVAFMCGVIISTPVIAYFLTFLGASKISKKARALICTLVIPVSMLLFAAGVIFGYSFLLPSTINFLLETGNEFMKANLSASSYFSFIGTLMLTVGALFELPLILITLSRIGIVDYKMLKKKRKFAVMSALISVAFISPSLDAFTFILVTLPIIALYEISILCIYLLDKNDGKRNLIKEESA